MSVMKAGLNGPAGSSSAIVPGEKSANMEIAGASGEGWRFNNDDKTTAPAVEGGCAPLSVSHSTSSTCQEEDRMEGVEHNGCSEKEPVNDKSMEEPNPEVDTTGPAAEDYSSSGGKLAGCGKKRRRRRGRGGRPERRRYKPYMKLSHEERRKLEQKEERRAEQARNDRFKHGIPVAPYNTTQFLLQDRQARTEHEREDVDVIVRDMQIKRRTRRRSTSNNTDGGGTDGSISDSNPDLSRVPGGSGLEQLLDSEESSGSELEDYLTKEFSEEYTSAHAERLEGLSKPELIREYIELERRLDGAEIRLGQEKQKVRNLTEKVDEFRGKVLPSDWRKLALATPSASVSTTPSLTNGKDIEDTKNSEGVKVTTLEKPENCASVTAEPLPPT